MKIVQVLLMTGILAACGVTNDRTATLSGVQPGGDKASAVDANLKLAKDLVASYMKDPSTSLKGMNGVGIGFCKAFWAEDALGLAHIMVAKPDYEGVKISFETEDAFLNFAKSTLILGDKISVYDANGSGKKVDVPVCAEAIGKIVAE